MNAFPPEITDAIQAGDEEKVRQFIEKKMEIGYGEFL